MKDTIALQQELTHAQQQVQLGAMYYHYKHPDRHYQIISIAFLESTEAVCVCYQALYAPYLTWIRPLANFVETIVVDGRETNRFTKL